MTQDSRSMGPDQIKDGLVTLSFGHRGKALRFGAWSI
jgi:hypothetical protein